MNTDAALRLRPLTLDDCNACAMIELACYPKPVCEGAEIFNRFVKSAAAGCWVVVDDAKAYDTIVGYMLCMPTLFEECPLELSAKSLPTSSAKNTLYLHDIAVAPEARNRGVAAILQDTAASLARLNELRTITLTAVCGAWDYWLRRGYSTLEADDDDDHVSDAARERLGSYPAECGAVRLMQLDLLRPRPTRPVEYIPSPNAQQRPREPEEAHDIDAIEEASGTEAAASHNGQTSPPPLRHSLPPKLDDAPRTRLSMRLATRLAPSLLSREPPPPYRVVKHGTLQRYGSCDYDVAICDYADAWARIIFEAGERATKAEAEAQYEKEVCGSRGGIMSRHVHRITHGVISPPPCLPLPSLPPYLSCSHPSRAVPCAARAVSRHGTQALLIPRRVPHAPATVWRAGECQRAHVLPHRR